MIDWKNLEEKPYAPLAEISRSVAADGCVLLKNENSVLPLTPDKCVSVFGRTQIDYYKSGTGSGGLVHTAYTVNIIDGMLNNNKINVNTDLLDVYKDWIKENPFDIGHGWATEPWCQKEMVPSEDIVSEARKKSATAVIVIGRTAGEDRDNSEEKGSWYLTDEEEALFDVVSRHFENTVAVLNVGNIIDMNWADKYNIKSVLYVWQGGQEGGNAVADVLSGDVNPSGRLSDTIAYHISDYPAYNSFGGKLFNIYQEDIYVGYRYFETFAKDRVMYPFGFGLSYTEFDINTGNVSECNGTITAKVTVTNKGSRAGREVVQAYFEAPQGKLGKSSRELCAFAKTHILNPGESEEIKLKINVSDMAAYDDSGITGNKSCYVLEAGKYKLYIGKCVRCAENVFTYDVNTLKVTQKLCEAMAPERLFEIMYPSESDGGYTPSYRSVSTRTVDYKQRIREKLPKEIKYTGDKGIKLIDVKNGKNTTEEFVAQLDDTDLRCIIVGEGMSSPKARPGNTGVFGGITKSLADFGIPVIALCDGPSGIRMDNGDAATSMPNGTLIACTWDTESAQKLYENLSVELCINKFDSLLGPGMNIHRYPLNGRNFEYMSEDPFLTGKICASLVKGAAVYGNSATIKHFAVNSQEYCRSQVDAVVSERALREIYLKGFEIAVKDGGAKSIMTSYNPVNGHWSSVNYELTTTVLRDNWGYTGFVMTDWWPKLGQNDSREKKNLYELAESQNDVYMLSGDSLNLNSNIEEALKDGTLTRGQLQRNAVNLLNYIVNTHSLERFVESGGKLILSLKDKIDELSTVYEYGAVNNKDTIDIDLDKPGKYLLCADYTSDASELAQLTISTSLNGVEATKATVRGTNGTTKTAYLDYTLLGTKMSVTFQFPEALHIKGIRVMR